MLRNHLKTLPYTKFILLQDSINARSDDMLEYLINENLKENSTKIQYCVFSGNFKRYQQKYKHRPRIILHDFTSNCLNWEVPLPGEGPNLEGLSGALGGSDVLVADTLNGAAGSRGLADTCALLNRLVRSGARQIVAVFHRDLAEGEAAARSLEHLSTCAIRLEPHGRLRYVLKRAGGKVLRQTELYRFEKEELLCEKADRLEPPQVTEGIHVNPEDLTTFRIGLTSEEKQVRDSVVLPYLPADGDADASPGAGARILYKLEDVDDWDEEDPDDDLDI